MKTKKKKPFWEAKRLEQMTPEEWDLLCDGCGRCCLLKLEDEETNTVHTTRLACALLDVKSCRCKDYANRQKIMDDCLSIDIKSIKELEWLPPSCSYKRLADGRGLAWWHHLISGSRDTVHEAGISIRNFARTERGIKDTNFYRYIIDDLVE